jgi:DNA repair protein SbcD/Mre11
MICAVIGDPHLDERSPRYEHALDMIRWSTQDAIEQGADHFFFLGDIFEGAPSPREYRAFIDVLFDLVKHGGFVGICRGNHEDYEALSFFETLHPMIRVAWDDTRLLRLGDVQILLIPYPTRHRAPYQNLDDGGTIAGSMQAASKRIAGWVNEANAPGQAPLIVLGHFTIQGMTTRDAEFELHSSQEPVVPQSAFSEADLVIVGHIHRRQQVAANIVGAGSLYRTSWAERDDPKGYVIVSADRDAVSWKYRDAPARELIQYEGEWGAQGWIQELCRG